MTIMKFKISIRDKIFEMQCIFYEREKRYPTTLHLPESKASEIKDILSIHPLTDISGRFFMGMKIIVDGAFRVE